MAADVITWTALTATGTGTLVMAGTGWMGELVCISVCVCVSMCVWVCVCVSVWVCMCACVQYR